MKKHSSRSHRFFDSVTITAANYSRLRHLLFDNCGDLWLLPVCECNSAGHSQQKDYGLLMSFLMLALCRDAPCPIYQLEPNSSTLRSCIRRCSVPHVPTLLSFLPQFRRMRATPERTLLLTVFHRLIGACMLLYPQSIQLVLPSERCLMMQLLERCYPASRIV